MEKEGRKCKSHPAEKSGGLLPVACGELQYSCLGVTNLMHRVKEKDNKKGFSISALMV